MYEHMMWGPAIFSGPLLPVFILLALWTVFWKGLALWHSAQRGQYWWFVIMLFLNTAGILELIYLFGIAKIKFDQLLSSKT